MYVAVAPSLTVAGPVIESFCASSAPACPGRAIRQREEEPSGAKPANGCARHLKPPPSTSPWCTTITVRKKGWQKNLPGRRGVTHAVRGRCRYCNSEATFVSSARRSKGTKDPGPTGVFRMRESPCSDEQTAVRTWGPFGHLEETPLAARGNRLVGVARLGVAFVATAAVALGQALPAFAEEAVPSSSAESAPAETATAETPSTTTATEHTGTQSAPADATPTPAADGARDEARRDAGGGHQAGEHRARP